MNTTKHLITITTAAIALLGAASSFAQTYGDCFDSAFITLDGSGDHAPKVATPAQAESIRQAGLRAAGIEALAVKR